MLLQLRGFRLAQLRKLYPDIQRLTCSGSSSVSYFSGIWPQSRNNPALSCSLLLSPGVIQCTGDSDISSFRPEREVVGLSRKFGEGDRQMGRETCNRTEEAASAAGLAASTGPRRQLKEYPQEYPQSNKYRRLSARNNHSKPVVISGQSVDVETRVVRLAT